MRRLGVSLKARPALHVTRVSLDNKKMVYVIVASKKLRYRHGTRSQIAYIGTTRNGASRMAQSAASLTDRVLRRHGVKSFDVRVITCHPRQGVKTWRKLERALLLVFRETYGRVPECNTQGKRIRELDEFKYFSKERLRKMLRLIGE